MTKLNWDKHKKIKDPQCIKGDKNAPKSKKRRKYYVVQFADGMWCYENWNEVVGDGGKECPLGSGESIKLAINKSFKSKWYRDKYAKIEGWDPVPEHPKDGKGFKLKPK